MVKNHVKSLPQKNNWVFVVFLPLFFGRLVPKKRIEKESSQNLMDYVWDIGVQSTFFHSLCIQLTLVSCFVTLRWIVKVLYYGSDDGTPRVRLFHWWKFHAHNWNRLRFHFLRHKFCTDTEWVRILKKRLSMEIFFRTTIFIYLGIKKRLIFILVQTKRKRAPILSTDLAFFTVLLWQQK